MHEYRNHQRNRNQERLYSNSGRGRQLWSRAEERILQLISVRALPEVLDEICSALDLQIANVVSLITGPGKNEGYLAEIALKAADFGLFTFCSADVVASNNELLGTLEIFCSVPRHPSAREFELIERAKSLAMIAITLDREKGQYDYGIRAAPPVCIN
jgi:hypothetical protein